MNLCYSFLLLLLLPTLSNAQGNFIGVDNWLEEHAQDLGGRAYLAIYKDDKIVHTKSVSEMNTRQKIAGKLLSRKQQTTNYNSFDGKSVVPFASCSKWLSAALVMTFVDEGKLSLSDTLGKFFKTYRKTDKGSITIVQCLSHLTAIKAPPLNQSIKSFRGYQNTDSALADIARLPMEGKPGQIFHYSNVGLQLAGAVVEKLTNKSFETLFQERIAKPLSMANTNFGNGPVAMPAGGAKSCADDYMHFLIMIKDKGIYKGKRILSERAIKQMQTIYTTPDVKKTYTPDEAGSVNYGLGEWVLLDQEKIVAVSSPGLFGTYPLVDLLQNYALILVAYNLNNKDRGRRYAQLKKLVDQALLQ